MWFDPPSAAINKWTLAASLGQGYRLVETFAQEIQAKPKEELPHKNIIKSRGSTR